MLLLPATQHRRMPWANGLGTTAEIATGPEGAAEWAWRVSIADVGADGPFSSLPGVDRFITVARGSGMALTVDGAPERRLDTSHPPFPFTGEAVTTCRLLDGPISDLNLMVRRARGSGALRVHHLAAGERISLEVSDVVVVLLEGTARLGSASLGPFDAVRLGPTPPSGPLEATAPSRIAVASFRPAAR